jgi:hypothetical protein
MSFGVRLLLPHSQNPTCILYSQTWYAPPLHSILKTSVSSSFHLSHFWAFFLSQSYLRNPPKAALTQVWWRLCQKDFNFSHHGAEIELLLLRLYRALICSKTDYSSFIYNPSSKTKVFILDPVHNAVLYASGKTCFFTVTKSGLRTSSPAVLQQGMPP